MEITQREMNKVRGFLPIGAVLTSVEYMDQSQSAYHISRKGLRVKYSYRDENFQTILSGCKGENNGSKKRN